MTRKTRPSRTIVTFTTRERQDVRGLIPQRNGDRLKELWKLEEKPPQAERAPVLPVDAEGEPAPLPAKKESEQAVTA